MGNSYEPPGNPLPTTATPKRKALQKRNIKLLSYQKCRSSCGYPYFKAADMNENNLFRTRKLRFTWNFAQLSQQQY